jgi:hypothetical protein
MCPKEAENWETEGIAGNPNNSQTRTDLVRLMVLRSAAVVQLYWTGLPEFSPFRYRTTYSEQRIATSNRHITSHVSDAVPGELVRSAIDNEFFDVSSLISHSGKCMSSRGHCFWE